MRYELSVHEWVAIRPLLPNKPGGPRSAASNLKLRQPQNGRGLRGELLEICAVGCGRMIPRLAAWITAVRL
jgi:hypothetical protein